MTGGPPVPAEMVEVARVAIVDARPTQQILSAALAAAPKEYLLRLALGDNFEAITNPRKSDEWAGNVIRSHLEASR